MPPRVRPGDRVAVVSPSWAGPGVFPELHEQAMRRLRDELGLVPVEFPSTRTPSSPQDRAKDLMAAWSDPSIRAVLATIGGDDQLTVLPHLDPAPFRADPKPFFGFSDNTNLLNWLWRHGLAGFHGGSTMMHLGRGGGLHPLSTASLRAALFSGGDHELRPAGEFSEEDADWDAPGEAVPTAPAPDRVWHRPEQVVTAPTWGGSLEILHWNLAADRWILPSSSYQGCVLLLETSEEMPSDDEVFQMLRNFGERGLLRQFPAILVATAKATFFRTPRPPAERAAYRDRQREAVLRALAAYHPSAMVVFNVDFGHTDPQLIVPYGGRITVDGPARRIVAHY